MRWYERLSGWRSRPTSAPSNSSVMITGRLITSASNTARSMTSWRMAAATATAYAHFHSLAIPYPPIASPTMVARPSRRLVEMTPNSRPKAALMYRRSVPSTRVWGWAWFRNFRSFTLPLWPKSRPRVRREPSRRRDLALVRPVPPVGREPEGLVEADRGLVVAVDEEHARPDPALGEIRQPGDDQRLPEPRSLAGRVDADHEDLAQLGVGVGRGVDLRPAEPGQPVCVEREQEPLRVEPGLGHAPLEGRVHPTALLRVVDERPVVDGQPDVVVLPRHEGPHLDPGRPRRRLGQRERDALLQEIALVLEPGARSGLVVARFGLEDPEHHQAATLTGDVLHGALEQDDLDFGTAAHVGVHEHAG